MKNTSKIKCCVFSIFTLIVSLKGEAQDKKGIFNFKLPFQHLTYIDPESKDTYAVIDFPGREPKQIVVDSTELKIDDAHSYYFYFLTPVTPSIEVGCPEDFGLIVFDKSGTMIYENFDTKHNLYIEIMKLNVGGKVKNYLVLGASGCMGAIGISYFDINTNNKVFTLNPALQSESLGFSFNYFLPNKEVYAHVKKINWESHYGGTSNYEISYYNIFSNKLLAKYTTKYKYQDFSEIEPEIFFSKIKAREPNVILF